MGDADAALELDLVVVVHARLPALAAVDGEAAILLVTALDDVAYVRGGPGSLRSRWRTPPRLDLSLPDPSLADEALASSDADDNAQSTAAPRLRASRGATRR